MTVRRVVATAGHVDHGKSTLVQALTGRDPDRLAEEKARGLTIDLGFAWTTLPSGAHLGLVDVPGHRRFIGTMLAGLGPSPAVLLVVAADQGWQEQTSEHLAAIDALAVEELLLVITRSDLADPAPVLQDARTRLGRGGRSDVPAVTISARTGAGMAELTTALEELLARLPAPADEAPVRLWVDRAFTIEGSGSVVTGTLGAGRVRAEDTLELVADGDRQSVRVRQIQSQDAHVEHADPVARVALNLRGVDRGEVARGSVLLTPGAWTEAGVLDVSLVLPTADDEVDRPRDPSQDLPDEVTLHVGTTDLVVGVRPLGPGHARVRLPRALPWRIGDRLLLRDPGSRRLWGAQVLDVDPLPLRRRGAAAARGGDLTQAGLDRPALRALRLQQRGAERRSDLEQLGLIDPAPGERAVGDLAVDAGALTRWGEALRTLVAAHRAAEPLSAGVPTLEAAHRLDLPPGTGPTLLPVLAHAAGLALTDGRLAPPQESGLGPAEAGVAAIEEGLRVAPFASPEQHELDTHHLGPRELAAAARLGRLLRLPGDVVLLPDAPARAMREIARLPQPFTLSQARQALGTTRRVAVPLMEHLDGRGWTRRVDDGQREVVR